MRRHKLDFQSLEQPTALPLKTIATMATDSVLVVAPHPDDETLGCGGAIALLRFLGCQVRVLVISDGTRSHPRSRRYPASKLRDLRESETRSAMTMLGVRAADIAFLRLPDGAIPSADSSNFANAVDQCRDYLYQFLSDTELDTVLLPWRYDPHPDHRASWQMMQAALIDLSQSPRLIEYPIWDWDTAQRGSGGSGDRVSAWRLDISQVVLLKQTAIGAYRSQTTDLIDDDPTGFRLTPDMLANFTRPWEVYFEAGALPDSEM